MAVFVPVVQLLPKPFEKLSEKIKDSAIPIVEKIANIATIKTEISNFFINPSLYIFIQS